MQFLNFSKTIIKNLFSKPVTQNYPMEAAEYPEGSRGHIDIVIDECISCGLCVRNCPTRCLSVDKKAGTWTINRFDCIACGYCTIKCPKKCLHLNKGYQEPSSQKKEAIYQKSPEVMEAERKKAEEIAKKRVAAKKAKEKKEAEEKTKPKASTKS